MQQVYSGASVDFGQAGQKVNWNWTGDNETVPPNQTLVIGAITSNYFPSGGGTLGRCDASGHDANGNTVWSVQIVYVEPNKTTHLTFPLPLTLDSGGHVEIGFTSDGPGTIFVEMNGQLT
jgi:hypothetical protein